MARAFPHRRGHGPRFAVRRPSLSVVIGGGPADHGCTVVRPEVLRAMTDRRRCAIYTRKSTDEGLEQGFNSLHAQREACEAYIMSQAHEGWKLMKTAYDDGGFSGGSMERPALQR